MKNKQSTVKIHPNIICDGKGKQIEFSGKGFHLILGKELQKIRIVPPFSKQTLQHGTVVYPPPLLDLFKENRIPKTLFRKYFERGDIPVRNQILLQKKKRLGNGVDIDKKLIWFVPPESLDYKHYLPIFFAGLPELKPPYGTIAELGIYEMVDAAPEKILEVLPYLMKPIKISLNTKIPEVITKTLKALQYLIKNGPCVGRALVPYYRHILPICNLFKHVNVNLGEGIDRKRNNRIGDVIEDTLQLLELCGGPDAYLNIKYIVPTYESYVMN